MVNTNTGIHLQFAFFSGCANCLGGLLVHKERLVNACCVSDLLFINHRETVRLGREKLCIRRLHGLSIQ